MKTVEAKIAQHGYLPDQIPTIARRVRGNPPNPMERALQYMVSLIKKGIDYSDAEWKASEKFKVDHKRLMAAYDESQAQKRDRDRKGRDWTTFANPPSMTFDQAVQIIGRRPAWELKNIVKALTFHSWLNSPEDTLRLQAAKVVLRGQRAKKNPAKRSRKKTYYVYTATGMNEHETLHSKWSKKIHAMRAAHELQRVGFTVKVMVDP